MTGVVANPEVTKRTRDTRWESVETYGVDEWPWALQLLVSALWVEWGHALVLSIDEHCHHLLFPIKHKVKSIPCFSLVLLDHLSLHIEFDMWAEAHSEEDWVLESTQGTLVLFEDEFSLAWGQVGVWGILGWRFVETEVAGFELGGRCHAVEGYVRGLTRVEA